MVLFSLKFYVTRAATCCQLSQGPPPPLPLPTFESLWHSDWGGWRVHSASSHSTWHTHKSQGVSGDKKLPDKLVGIPGQQCHVGPSCLRCNVLGWLCCLHASITKDLWAKLALLFEKHGVSFNSGVINDNFVGCNSLIFILQRKITNTASKHMVVNWYIEKHSVYLNALNKQRLQTKVGDGLFKIFSEILRQN